tara:strand:- start:23 stop:382 length:360 start_codon:yes stop_codon:yes gene_type:complete
MLELIFALTGIVFGIILANIAPEEILPGEKYFLWLKRIIFIGLLITMIYYSFNELLFLMIPLLMILVFALNLKFENDYFELGYYSLFIVFYLLTTPVILAILIFLYGLPTGTLLMRRFL